MNKVTLINAETPEGLMELVNIKLENLKDAKLVSLDLPSLLAVVQFDEQERKMKTDCQHCIDCIHFAEHSDCSLTGWCSFYGMNKRKDKRAFTCKHFSDEYEG